MLNQTRGGLSVSVYDIVTEKIVKKLESGVIPWRKPWGNFGAVNWMSQKAYRGINAILLDAGEYATFKQIEAVGGKVKKGSKAHLVTFWKMLDGHDEDGNPKKVPLLRYYNVFEVNTQCEGINSKRKDVHREHTPVEVAEQIVSAYKDAPELKFASGSAYYMPSSDYVSVPPLQDYENKEDYYSTLFHELTHSTGHKTRLARPGVVSLNGFGSETYSKEELVAEIGAAMLCGTCGIEQVTIDNSASYIASWLRRLKDDKTLIVSASSQAQKAADYIQGIASPKEEQE